MNASIDLMDLAKRYVEEHGKILTEFWDYQRRSQTGYWQERVAEEFFRMKLKEHSFKGELVEIKVHWANGRERRKELEEPLGASSDSLYPGHPVSFDQLQRWPTFWLLMVQWNLEDDQFILRILGERDKVTEYLNDLNELGELKSAHSILQVMPDDIDIRLR